MPKLKRPAGAKKAKKSRRFGAAKILGRFTSSPVNRRKYAPKKAPGEMTPAEAVAVIREIRANVAERSEDLPPWPEPGTSWRDVAHTGHDR